MKVNSYDIDNETTVAVVGLWHLGSVTAACMANAGYKIIAYDPDLAVIENLKNGIPPIFEPGLEELVNTCIKSGKLKFTNRKEELKDADIIWVTFDTPVDDDDKADVEFVTEQVMSIFSCFKTDATVLISSQLPVGSTKLLQTRYQNQFPKSNVRFAYSPENLRLGKAINVFTHPDRIVIGVDVEATKLKLAKLLLPFTSNIEWMSIPSAEMTKHALNAFLATSVVFINELASLCEQVGADASEVERGLKSESRIGKTAYLKPGNAFAGGTLARDVSFLIQIGKQQHLPTELFSAVIESNNVHRSWAQRRLSDVLGPLSGKTIAILGLTYKPGTDTLRRSAAIETCRVLQQQGVNVVAYDPVVKTLPDKLKTIISLQETVQDAIQNADAAVIATEWPEFKTLTTDDFIGKLKQPLLFDANGFLAKNINQNMCYFTVGRGV